MAFQFRLHHWRLPRYAGIRWTRLIFNLGPLHFCRVTLEPDSEDTPGDESGDSSQSELPVKTRRPLIDVSESGGHVRRIEIPEARPPDSTRYQRPVSVAQTRTVSISPVPQADPERPTKSASPYLDDADLDLLADLLCQNGNGNGSRQIECANLAERNGNEETLPLKWPDHEPLV